MPTIFSMLVYRLNRSNRPTRVSRDYCNWSVHGDARKPLSAYKRVVSFCTTLLKPSGPVSSQDTLVAQCWITVSTTILNMVRYSGLPCVTPLDPVNRALPGLKTKDKVTIKEYE